MYPTREALIDRVTSIAAILYGALKDKTFQDAIDGSDWAATFAHTVKETAKGAFDEESRVIRLDELDLAYRLGKDPYTMFDFGNRPDTPKDFDFLPDDMCDVDDPTLVKRLIQIVETVDKPFPTNKAQDVFQHVFEIAKGEHDGN